VQLTNNIPIKNPDWVNQAKLVIFDVVSFCSQRCKMITLGTVILKQVTDLGYHYVRQYY